jgi:hypothetical protein
MFVVAAFASVSELLAFSKTLSALRGLGRSMAGVPSLGRLFLLLDPLLAGNMDDFPRMTSFACSNVISGTAVLYEFFATVTVDGGGIIARSFLLALRLSC